MKIFFIYLAIFFLVDCAYEVTRRVSLPISTNQKQSIQILSEDRILTDILCDSIERSQAGKCVEEISKTDLSNTKTIKVQAEITDSSSDYFKNMGKSLVTLTTGVFISNSAQVQFKIQTHDAKTNLFPSKDITSSGRIGRWGILPFYAGLAATNFGTLLNTYRNPEHLQKYCLNDPVSKIRKIFEAKKEDYCEEYALYLKDSFYKVEKEFIEIMEKENKNEN